MPSTSQFLFLLVASIVAGIAGLIAYKSSQKRRKEWGSISAFLVPVLTVLASYLIFYTQEILSHRLNSEAVLQFSLGTDKVLKIKNKGFVDIEDIRIFQTEYKLSGDVDEKNHLYLSGIESVSTASRPIQEYEYLKAGQTQELNLPSKTQGLFLFYEGIPDPHDLSNLLYYVIRITFRNSVTKQKHIKYLLTSAVIGFPSFVDDPESISTGGPYEIPTEGLSKLKKMIIEDQSNRYGDEPSEFYRN